jgi:hypothetical protein
MSDFCDAHIKKLLDIAASAKALTHVPKPIDTY